MKKLTPFKGMDNVSHDDQMEAKGDTRFIRLRDAVNVDVSSSGRIAMRRTGKPVSDIPYKSVWQSSLHGDVFGVVDLQLVRINVADWSYEILGEVRSEKINYEIINNLVYLCDGFDLYTFNGELLQKLTIDTPPSVLCEQRESGALKSGKYTISITWEVKGKESALSPLFSIDAAEQSSVDVILPYCFDSAVDTVNIYCTSRDGTDLRKYDSIPIAERLINISNTENLGRSIQFKNLSPMKAGKFLGYWQGRLVIADRNVIQFSQALNFHLFDERYDFISNLGGRSSSVKLLLAGMALSAVCSAFSSFIVYFANDKDGIQTITYWLMGSLAGARWNELAVIAPIVILSVLFFWTQSRVLNLMLLGDEAAITMGTDLHVYRQAYLLVSSLIVGFAVYSAGVIGP